jgi:hypothetical protein
MGQNFTALFVAGPFSTVVNSSDRSVAYVASLSANTTSGYAGGYVCGYADAFADVMADER